MKKAVYLLIVSLLLCSNVSAVLSPAIDIISENLNIYKCSVMGNEVTFSSEDFEEIYPDIEYLTIKELPDSESGVLKIGGIDAVKNQTISASSIAMMKFVPAEGKEINANFSVCDAFNSDSSVNCNIYVLSSLNVAPKVKSASFKSAKNTKLYKRMFASDTENDELTFTIKSYPKHGKLSISDSKSGAFVYTPEHDYVGKDKFSYICTDSYGNESEKATVTINIINNDKSVFSDMTNHWGSLSASKMSELGIMSAENGLFMPDKEITRGDFVAMATIATGNEKNVALCYTTTFSDDSEIPMNIKSYAEYALSSGVISGYTENDKINFCSSKPITRAEASVILYNLAGVPEYNSENSVLPEWAKTQMLSLNNCGILNGDLNGNLQPDKTLTKAEAAELLYNTMDYIKENESKSEKKSIFNLFGLLKN